MHFLYMGIVENADPHPSGTFEVTLNGETAIQASDVTKRSRRIRQVQEQKNAMIARTNSSRETRMNILTVEEVSMYKCTQGGSDLPAKVGIVRMGALVACPLIGTVVEGGQVGMECRLDLSCFGYDPTRDERESCQ